jgi:quercetin dioxygenase-like cupin family protein
MTDCNELGFFGNIWVRQNMLHKAGDRHGGHKHHFDHISLLTKGKVRVEIEGYPPKEFTAPTFIIIKKEHAHDFVALEDDVNWYCVFALRDLDGQVVEVFDAAKHNPLSASIL